MSTDQKINPKLLSLYKWFFSQDDKNVIVKFKMPQNFKSEDIQINLEENQIIEVFVKGKLPFLKGTLFQPIKSYEKSILSNFFILTFTKIEPIDWKYLIMAVSKNGLTADPKSSFLLGIDQKDRFPNEPFAPLLSVSALYHYPSACLYIGNYYKQQGNTDYALDNYKMIADEYNDPTAEFQTGIILNQLHRTDEAKEYLYQALKAGVLEANEVLKEIEITEHQKHIQEERSNELEQARYETLVRTAAMETSAIGGAALQATALETVAAETALQTTAMIKSAEKAANAIGITAMQATAIENAAIQAAAIGSAAIAAVAAETNAVQAANAETAAIQTAEAEVTTAGLAIQSIGERNAELNIAAAETATAETALLGTAAAEAAVIEAEVAARVEEERNDNNQPHDINNNNQNTEVESKSDKIGIIISCIAIGVSLAFLLYQLKKSKR